STLGPTPTPTPTPTPKPTPAGGQGQAQPAARPADVISTDSTTPTPLPAGYKMVHVAAATGTQETITVFGDKPTVLVDSASTSLNAKGEFIVDVQPGSNHPIVVSYPATPPSPDPG